MIVVVSGVKQAWLAWEGGKNVGGWERIEDVPQEYLEEARLAKRVMVTEEQWNGIKKEVEGQRV